MNDIELRDSTIPLEPTAGKSGRLSSLAGGSFAPLTGVADNCLSISNKLKIGRRNRLTNFHVLAGLQRLSRHDLPLLLRAPESFAGGAGAIAKVQSICKAMAAQASASARAWW